MRLASQGPEIACCPRKFPHVYDSESFGSLLPEELAFGLGEHVLTPE